MSAEWPIYVNGDTEPDLPPVQLDLYPIKSKTQVPKKLPQGLSTYIRKQTDTIVNLDQPDVDPDGAWNYTGRPPKPGEVVFMPASKGYITENTGSNLNVDLDSSFSFKSFMSFLLMTAVAVGYFEYNKNFQSNQLSSSPVAYKTIPAVVQTPVKPPIIQVQESTNSLIENQISESLSLQDTPTPDSNNTVPTPETNLEAIDTFQDYQLDPEDNSVETAELFERDFQELKQIISRLNIPRSRAHDHFNSSIFSQQLIDISNKYNTDQKMQVFVYLENLHIIPSSARQLMQKNTSALLKIYDYLNDFNSESNIERKERVKQRAYSLLLRSVVERASLDELTFIINSFNPAAQLTNNSSYTEVINAVGNDSDYNLNPDRIMGLQPFVSNGLYNDVEFFRNTYLNEIEHLDVITTRTITAIGLHETAPRLSQVEQPELANMLLLELYDYNPWNMVRFKNGILTLGPTQLQDWKIRFDRFPQNIQDKVIALGANIGVEVTDMVSAMRASVLSPEIQFILSTSLISANLDTMNASIDGFENASISTQRNGVIYANLVGMGAKGRESLKELYQNNTLAQNAYVDQIKGYIRLLIQYFTK